MNSTIKTVIFWLVILVSATLLWQVIKSGNSRTHSIPEIGYSQFLSQVDAGSVIKVRISKVRVDGAYRDGSAFRSIAPARRSKCYRSYDKRTSRSGIQIRLKNQGGAG